MTTMMTPDEMEKVMSPQNTLESVGEVNLTPPVPALARLMVIDVALIVSEPPLRVSFPLDSVTVTTVPLAILRDESLFM